MACQHPKVRRTSPISDSARPVTTTPHSARTARQKSIHRDSSMAQPPARQKQSAPPPCAEGPCDEIRMMNCVVHSFGSSTAFFAPPFLWRGFEALVALPHMFRFAKQSCGAPQACFAPQSMQGVSASRRICLSRECQKDEQPFGTLTLI